MDVSSARNLISNKNSNTQSIPAVRDTKYWRNKIKVKSDKDVVQAKEITEQETKPIEPYVEEIKPVTKQVMNINDYREVPTEPTCEDIINSASITETQEVEEVKEVKEMHVMDDLKSTKGSIIENRCESPSNYLVDLLGLGLPSDYESSQDYLNKDYDYEDNSVEQPSVSESTETTPLKSGVKYKLAYVPENILNVLAEIVECPVESELTIKGTTYALVDINNLKE